jgi:hypothetical protein
LQLKKNQTDCLMLPQVRPAASSPWGPGLSRHSRVMQQQPQQRRATASQFRTQQQGLPQKMYTKAGGTSRAAPAPTAPAHTPRYSAEGSSRRVVGWTLRLMGMDMNLLLLLQSGSKRSHSEPPHTHRFSHKRGSPSQRGH